MFRNTTATARGSLASTAFFWKARRVVAHGARRRARVAPRPRARRPAGRRSSSSSVLRGRHVARGATRARRPRGLAPEEATTRAARTAAPAVVRRHAHGIAHRDLKPNNVFGARDEPGSLKVIDFGLSLGTAHSRDDGAPKVPRPRARSSASAPETLPQRDAATGATTCVARYTPAADVWALGTILFEMLVGEPLVDLDDLDDSSREFRPHARRVRRRRRARARSTRRARACSERLLAARLARARASAPAAACELLERMLRPTRRSEDDRGRRAEAPLPRGRPRARAGGGAAAAAAGFDAGMRARCAGTPTRPLVAAPRRARRGVDDGARDETTGALRIEGRAHEPTRAATASSSRPTRARSSCTGAQPVPDDLDAIFERIDIAGTGTPPPSSSPRSMEPRGTRARHPLRVDVRCADADGDGFITARDVEAILAARKTQMRPLRAEAIVRSPSMGMGRRCSRRDTPVILAETRFQSNHVPLRIAAA